MCRQLVLLAKNDYRQMIFTCEHGTVHLSHKHTTVCLSRFGFEQFAAWVVEGNLNALEESGAWHVRETAPGQVELWLGSGGMRMKLAEFRALTDLMRSALQRLENLNLEELPVMRAELPDSTFKPSLN